ncbi:MAG: ABC transporter ATP-binding protein [Rhizonema sp. PD37]|nr:ABC transporter ATP-binding protein [Rhizonema sp. PD37]
MSDTVIRVENLAKKYVIGHQQEGRSNYKSLRESLGDGAKSLLKTVNPLIQNPKSKIRNPLEEFWALNDVSFEIKQGDCVGVIGHNGAGKSTLLKVLSRITEPTSGSIRIKGRVASLLEVGTGFHPELTGRENIFLNGAILGMSKVEIGLKFDEIVAFAEIEKFLDTPVKRYSSGMYVRLAFAVAAHLEPEILIVDEVLAVGDSRFQKKCLGKMEQVSTQEGRTILFVSHNMGAIRNLCRRAILLERGKLIEDSTFEIALSKYLTSGSTFEGYWQRVDLNTLNQEISILEVKIMNNYGENSGYVSSTEPFYIDVSIHTKEIISNAQIHIRITNQEGIPVLTTANTDANQENKVLEKGIHNYRLEMPSSFLPPGVYNLIIAAIKPTVKLFDIVDSKVSFSIEDMGGHSTILRDGRLGVVTPILNWQKLSISKK